MLAFGPYRQTKRLPRYIRQRDKHSCGAVALLNALKWAGYNVIYKRDFSRIYRSCKCNKDGTFPYHFDIAIRRYKKLVVLPEDEPFSAPSIKLVDECLDNDGAVVMAYIYKFNGKVEVSHITLCIGRQGKRYVFVNNSIGAKRTTTLQRRKTVIKMLRFSECGDGCEVWFLMRLDNKTLR